MREIPLKDKISFSLPSGSGLALIEFYAFNTRVSLKLVLEGGLGEKDAEAALHEVLGLCRDYEWKLSRTLEGSEVHALNDARGAWAEISLMTWEALQLGKFYSSVSRGTFDVTMGRVTGLWDFHAGRVPSEAALADAVRGVDWRRLEFMEIPDGEGDTRRFARIAGGCAAVDLGGSAKGLIADRIRGLLVDRGWPGGFVSLGGNVVVFGHNERGGLWNVGIRNPFGDGVIGCVPLSWGSVVTSGASERKFSAAGRTYHHILDCRTGKPAESDLASVSVVARRSCDADGYSTTLFCLGFEGALDYLRALEGVEAVLIKKDGTVFSTEGLPFVRRTE